MIKVLIADDQAILADGIKSVLSSDGELEVVGIAGNGEEAVRLTEELSPDVVLMDIRMPVMNGVISTQQIKRARPEVKVLVLTTFDDSDYILGAINNGASGYLLKDTSASALIDSIKNAYAGDTILPAKIARHIADAARMVGSDRELKLKRAFSFSDRETEIALMLLDGFTNKQIAAVDEVLMCSLSQGIMVAGASPCTIPEEDVIESYENLVGVTGASALVGCFDYNGLPAYYVFNNNNTTQETISLEFDSACSGYSVKAAVKEEFSGQSTMDLTLAAGEAVLIVLE